MALVLKSYPLPIKADPDGVVRVSGTRVTLDTVVAEFKNGATPEQIAHDYPVLQLADIYAVISYYLSDRDEVEQYLTAQQQEGERTRQEMEARFDPQGIRDRLLARRSKKDRQDAPASGR
jgi:uncharacterized protein (DUF433 family)